MRKTIGVVTIIISMITACSSNGSSSNSGVVCCYSPTNDAGVTACGCQTVGTVSQGPLTSTLTVTGSSCTMTTSLNGNSSSSTGAVVSSCPDGF